LPLAATSTVPFCVGAANKRSVPLVTLTRPSLLLASAPVMVVLLFSAKVPELATLLLIAPRITNVPVLVTGPLKNVSAVTATVAALLKPPLERFN